MNTLSQHSASAGHGKGYSFLVAIGASIGGLLYGYDTGIIASALLFLREDFAITDNAFMQSVVTSATLLGAIFGALLTGPLSDRLGRRKTVIVISLLFALFALGCALATSLTMLIVMRFLLGLGVGGSSQIVPMYIAELAPAHRRGAQGVLFQMMICVGTLLAYAVGYLLGPSGSWEWMLGLAVIPAVIFVVMMLFLPESPRWLVGKQQALRAKAILMRVGRTEQEAGQEVDEIQRLHSQQQSSWRELFQPWVRPALVAGLGIAIFSQATGISAIIYYAPSLLVMAQFGKSAAILGSVGIGVVLTAFTLLGIWLLDVLGRRRLMLIGLPGAVIVLVVMSLLLPWSANAQEILSDTNKVVVLTCLLGYFAFNGGSLSVVTWLYCAEIFPLGVRGKGTALCSFTLWTVNFIVTLLLYFSADALGIGLVFGVLAIVNALAWFFVWGYAPETRGRSLEDIEQSLINGQFNPRQALSLHKINSD
ncbi:MULTISPECIES: sugar porter family MFS transporter [Buttiauxella]|uniref:sugar porter family MFS transporter n=1 Tax=Buttiauxella TaxID=82976 RepID=UPI001065918C|nr:sugar porter family MFS transporter [Buttiauxella sp. BIGb0552]TDX11014.1 sugar porter (SP) family MFS transporter [Buttiauxella sp. BIGb0552]